MRRAIGLLCAAAFSALHAGMAAAQTEMGVATAPESQDAPAEVQERRLDILNYHIEGNTVLPRTAVEQAVYPFLGPRRSVADVESARAALEAAYREAGYPTVGVNIPEQDVRNGVIRLDVVELRVGQVRVTGSRYFSPEGIRERAPSLSEGNVPNYNDFARDLGALNRSADRTITPSLRSGVEPGTIDIDLEVEDKNPLHSSVELNDRFSNRSERLRMSAMVGYSNLFQREHSLNLQVQTTPDDVGENLVFSASYVAPVLGTNLTLLGYGVHSESDVAAVNGINVVGQGNIVGMRAIYAFPTQHAVHQLIAGVDYKDFNEDLVVGPLLGSTPIDYMPMVLQYGYTRRGEATTFDANLSLNFGLRGLAADDDEFRFKRYLASASWAYVRGDVDWRIALPADTAFRFRAGGQVTEDPLISNEQFAIGGLDTVRGYYESQELGDYGGYVQLQFDSPSIHRFTFGDEWRFFVFADGGHVRLNDVLAVEGVAVDEHNLASVGLGSNLRFMDHFNASLVLAAPLIDREATQTDIDGRYRAQFRLWAEF